MARSGLAAALLADRLGAEVFVSDNKPAHQLTAQVAELTERRIKYEVGGHSDRLLECDYLVISPGVPPSVEIVQKATGMGIPIFSEIEFSWWLCRGTVIAITGSNGKTTTTTLIGEILKAAGRSTFVCGNIGRPLAEVVTDVPEDGLVVLEVSTFQLERVDTFAPHIAMILNLAPDHLDRHGTYEAYKQLKYRVAENQTSDAWLVLNQQDQDSMADEIATEAQQVLFTTNDMADAISFVRDGWLWVRRDGTESRMVATNQIRIPGPHNLQNSAAAAAVATLLDIPGEVVAEVLQRFPGVEHRLEKVDRVAGIDFINDSKATNVDSVCYALKSIHTPLYLIAGGRGKGASYEPMIECGRGKLQGVFLIGEEAQEMHRQLSPTITCEMAASLEGAVMRCFAKAQPGDTVLLSPACASFDMFESFEHRGRIFKQAVAALRVSQENEKKQV